MGDGDVLTGHLMAPGYRNWSAYRLDDIWEMVRHEDGRINFAQYYAWRRMAQLCEEEADQLDKAVNQLIQRWPDRPGSAAEAFKTFVGGMTSSMRETATAAAANADALYSLTIDLLTARAQIANLIEQRSAYTQAEQQMIEYTAAVGRQRPDQPIQAPPPMPQQPPDYWWEHLDRRARNVMAEADIAIASDTTRFQIPPRYVSRVDPGDSQVRRPPGTAALPTEVVSSTLDIQPPFGVVPPLVQDHPHDASRPIPVPGRADAPLLEGGPLPADSPTPSSAASRAPNFGSSSPLPNPVLGPGHVIASPMPGTPTSGIPAGQGVGARPFVAATRAVGSVPPSVAPMIPPPMPSRPAGTPGANISPSGRAASPYGRRPKNPNDPWAVSEGVPAVLEPSPEPAAHEPGPGVIGIDR